MNTDHYVPADSVVPGDILPDVSRQAVTRVDTFPNESVRVTFGHGEFIRHFPHRGPDLGFLDVRVERA